MTADDIKRARALLAAATPGPWEVHPDPRKYVIMRNESDERVLEDRDANAAFIAAARTLVCQLLDEVERLTRVHAGDVEYGSAEHQEMYTPLAQRLMAERETAVAERDAARAELMRHRVVAEKAADYVDNFSSQDRGRDLDLRRLYDVVDAWRVENERQLNEKRKETTAMAISILLGRSP